MKSAPQIAITLACAYCNAKLIFSQGATTLTNRHGAVAREGKLAELKCPHCDSVFEVELTTKRKRQGAGYKRAESKRRELHDQNVAEAKTRNAEIAKQLLAQPGCTCGETIEYFRDNFPEGHEQRLAQYGHAFSSHSVSYGIPNAPHHNHGCPCRGTDEEDAIRSGKGAA